MSWCIVGLCSRKKHTNKLFALQRYLSRFFLHLLDFNISLPLPFMSFYLPSIRLPFRFDFVMSFCKMNLALQAAKLRKPTLWKAVSFCILFFFFRLSHSIPHSIKSNSWNKERGYELSRIHRQNQNGNKWFLYEIMPPTTERSKKEKNTTIHTRSKRIKSNGIDQSNTLNSTIHMSIAIKVLHVILFSIILIPSFRELTIWFLFLLKQLFYQSLQSVPIHFCL